jgi:hypothetical protein
VNGDYSVWECPVGHKVQEVALPEDAVVTCRHLNRIPSAMTYPADAWHETCGLRMKRTVIVTWGPR